MEQEDRALLCRRYTSNQHYLCSGCMVTAPFAPTRHPTKQASASSLSIFSGAQLPTRITSTQSIPVLCWGERHCCAESQLVLPPHRAPRGLRDGLPALQCLPPAMTDKAMQRAARQSV